MIILGVDPGLNVTGYGLVEIVDRKSHQPKLHEVGIIKPVRRDKIEFRLYKVYKHLEDIIRQYVPHVIVLEQLYSHYERPTVASQMGHVRGVICLLCAIRNVKLAEFSVKRIRKNLVGDGSATKQQTREVVGHLLKVDASKMPLDASDALALALGYAHMQHMIG